MGRGYASERTTWREVYGSLSPHRPLGFRWGYPPAIQGAIYTSDDYGGSLLSLVEVVRIYLTWFADPTILNLPGRITRVPLTEG